MSDRLYKSGSGSYYTIWNDSTQDNPQKSEGLRTKNKKEARERLHTLTMLYNAGYHNPWSLTWQKNKRIKHYVYSGDLTKIDLAKGNLKTGLTLLEAIEEYIVFKSERKYWNENSQLSIPPTLRAFANQYSILIDDLSEKIIHDYLKNESDSFRENFMRRLNAFMNWAVSRDYLTNKPSYKVHKAQVAIPEIISNDVLKKACYDCIRKGHTSKQTERVWQPLGWLMLRFTGMRPMELLSLKVSAVYEDRILVGESFTTKTRSQRFVDIHDPLKPVIGLLKSKEFRSYCTHSKDHILGRSGKSQQNWLAERFKHFTDSKLYSLKDTYGFWIISDKSYTREYKLIYLRDQFGHSSLATTEKYLKYAPKGKEVDDLHELDWIEPFVKECRNILNT